MQHHGRIEIEIIETSDDDVFTRRRRCGTTRSLTFAIDVMPAATSTPCGLKAFSTGPPRASNLADEKH